MLLKFQNRRLSQRKQWWTCQIPQSLLCSQVHLRAGSEKFHLLVKHQRTQVAVHVEVDIKKMSPRAEFAITSLVMMTRNVESNSW
mmetsp:Transcript_56518/g.89758  ORF Transcript_56518/g.89758 Transcript_56518/m.89758 type:complete len:85 (-) Transcript_56518:246-500(-)